MGVIPSAEELAGLLIHKRVAATRDGLRLSQIEFGKKVGVTERTVKRWESESGDLPRRENAERIGELAGRPAELYYLQQGEWADMRAFVAAVDRLEAVLRDAGQLTPQAEGSREGAATAPTGPTANTRLTPEQIDDRLAKLEALVAELPTADDLARAAKRLQAAIDRLASRGIREAPEASSAPNHGAVSK